MCAATQLRMWFHGLTLPVFYRPPQVDTWRLVEGLSLSLDVSISSRADCKEAELRRAGGQRSGHSTGRTGGLQRRYRCNSKKMKEGLESRIRSFLVSRVALPSTGPKKACTCLNLLTSFSQRSQSHISSIFGPSIIINWPFSGTKSSRFS